VHQWALALYGILKSSHNVITKVIDSARRSGKSLSALSHRRCREHLAKPCVPQLFRNLFRQNILRKAELYGIEPRIPCGVESIFETPFRKKQRQICSVSNPSIVRAHECTR
jgi:hypothetical protein